MNDRIGFSRGKQIISHIIMWATGGKVSHAFIVYFDEDFQADYIFEATTWGIRIVPFETYKKKYNVVAVYSPGHPLTRGFLELGLWIGRKYDFTGLVGMLFVLFGRFLQCKWKNFMAAPKAMFCSEAVSNVLLWSNYPNFNLDPGTVDPKQLMNFCNEHMIKVWEK